MENEELVKMIASDPEKVREILCGLETKTNAPICKTKICNRPLSYIEKTGCWRCLVCNPWPKNVKTEEPVRKYVDQQMTEGRVKEILGQQMTAEDVRKIVIDAMAEFTPPESDPDYPPTRAEITQIAESVTTIKPETWRQKAKRLGVQTHHPDGMGMRKKAEILADVEKLENEAVSKELRTEE